MTIARGEPWGTTEPWNSSIAVARVDSDIREHVRSDRRRVRPVGGDLALSLGVRGSDDAAVTSGRMRCLPMDSYEVEWSDASGTTHAAHGYAHLVHGRWWRDESWWFAAGGFIRGRDVLSRSHPNDGVVDVMHVAPHMTLRQRLLALRRTRWGTHVPHPDITILRSATLEWRASAARPLWIDGQRTGSAVRVRITVRPDAWTACIREY